jgi:hypothetical protein
MAGPATSAGASHPRRNAGIAENKENLRPSLNWKLSGGRQRHFSRAANASRPDDSGSRKRLDCNAFDFPALSKSRATLRVLVP